MKNRAIEYFLFDFSVQKIVQEKQFENWLRFTFYTSNSLLETYDTIYQESFYIRFYELITTGLEYSNEVSRNIDANQNPQKHSFYISLIEWINKIKDELTETELIYIEYRRHCACHIFQDGYEHIQKDLKIKKEKKGKELSDVIQRISGILKEHGSDKAVDIYLMNKLQPRIKEIYLKLK